MTGQTTERGLTKERANEIISEIKRFDAPDIQTNAILGYLWDKSIRWSRNEIQMTGDRYVQIFYVERKIRGYSKGGAATNQFDRASLEAAFRVADHRARVDADPNEFPGEPYVVPPASLTIPNVPAWASGTANDDSSTRARLADVLNTEAHARDLVSSGYIQLRTGASATLYSDYGFHYSPYTQAQASATVRTPTGTASGWSGVATNDWSTIEIDRLAKRALDTCITSFDPVRIEPGRYTVILEPQATGDLLETMMDGRSLAMSRREAEKGRTAFSWEYDRQLDLWMSKLGQRVVDERVTIYHDPTEAGTAVLSGWGLAPITWIDHGVLTTLEMGSNINDGRRYSLEKLNRDNPDLYRQSFRMLGGDSTIEQMIASTRRGLLVTRFSNILLLDRKSLLSTGTTRDGLWLIEDGKISKPVRNLRFVESVLFAFNQIQEIGQAEQIFRRIPPVSGGLQKLAEVFRGPISAVVPAIKAADFNFAATVDAV